MNPRKRSHADKERNLEFHPNKKQKLAIQSNLEEIINSPGLQHIVEEIFLNLDFEDIQACAQINIPCKKVIENPIFWLKKWRLRGLSKKNHEDWIKAIQITRNTPLEENVYAYIKMIIKIGHFVDVPCYINSKVVAAFSNEIWFNEAFQGKNAGILQLLAAKYIKTEEFNQMLFNAVRHNKIDLLKVLAPLTENLNISSKLEGDTSLIALAASKGHLNIIKFLVPLTKDPNGPDKDGWIPIHYATVWRRLEVIKYLAPLTENPNAQTKQGGVTPIFFAVQQGFLDVIKILAPFCKNPNTPTFSGLTPIQRAERNGSDEIKSFLQSYINDAPAS